MTSAGDEATLPAAPADSLRHFCTLRKNNSRDDGANHAGQHRHLREGDTANPSADADRIGRFCTVRGVARVNMGNVSGGLGPGEHGNSDEVNRNLLYEENMCTFENFCEKSLEGETAAGSESIENFCTLRKKRQQKVGSDGGSEVLETALGGDGQGSNQVGSYCTLKKKKLKLNQRFVESFLEDPNAKLHDYLSELDAYLDEIDGLDSCDDDDEVAAREESSVDGDCEATCEEIAAEDVFKKSEQKVSPMSYIDVKNFCTLPKKKRVQFLSAFNRAGPLRRTFAAPNGRSSGLIRREVITEADDESPATDRDSAVATASGEGKLIVCCSFFPFGLYDYDCARKAGGEKH